MGENLHLASKRRRNQPFWERLGWRLLHQVIKNVPIPVGRTNNFQNFRTQDDSIYVNGHGIRWSSMAIVTSRRVVFWNDANGSAFVLSPVGSEGLEKHPLVVEDCTVIILIVILSIRWLGQHHCHHQWFDMSRIRMSLRMLIAILNLKHLTLDIVTVGIFRLSMLEPPGTIGLVSTQYIRETNKSIEIFGNGQVSLRMEQWIPSLMFLLVGIRWAVVQHARWGGRRGRSQPHLQVGHHQTPRMRNSSLTQKWGVVIFLGTQRAIRDLMVSNPLYSDHHRHHHLDDYYHQEHPCGGP